MRACSMSPGSRACSCPHLKLPDCFPPPMAASASADKAACTWQPHLRPGYCLHAVSSLDVVTCSPLTPLATYSTYSGLYPSDQDALTPGTIILSDHVPGLHRVPVIAHEPSMSSLCERERKQDRERDRKQERDSQPPGHPFMSPHFSHHLPTVIASGANGRGANADGVRGVGARGANVDWGGDRVRMQVHGASVGIDGAVDGARGEVWAWA